jgi:RNA polymerase-binding protein DksA
VSQTAAPKRTAKKTVAKAPAKEPAAPKTAGSKTAARAVTAAPAETKKPAPPPARKIAIRRPPVPPKRKVTPAKFDKAQLKAIRAQLEREKSDLQNQQRDLEVDSFNESQSGMTGEVGLDDDFADAGSATFDREQALSIRNNIRDLVEQITRAIGKIDEGTYGTCERCGNPIDAARIKALPHALLCLDCKRREERAR